MPSDRSMLARRAFGVLALVVATAALVPSVRAYLRAVGQLPRRWASVAGRTLEDRRRAAYGVCDGYGYGYVVDVLRAYPEDGALPVVKYWDWERRVRLVLPDRRTRTDDRVLVGIGLEDADLADVRIAPATPAAERADGGASVARWTFNTKWDYDLLTGLAFELAGVPSAGARELEIRLIHSAREERELGRWTVVPPVDGTRFQLRFAEPIRSFSHSRGATPFVLEVRTPPGVPRPTSIVPVAVRVDARGYEVVQRRGACFTAVRADLLAAARAEPDGAWGRFVRGLQ